MVESILNKNENLPPRERLQLTENAQVVLKARYLKKDQQGNILETPEQMFQRVADHVSRVEKQFGADDNQARIWQRRFYNLMASLRFLPNSPTLMNAGREMAMLSACFVLPVPDSIDGIFDAVKNTALIQKAGGGTGFSFDSLRPTGDHIASSGGKTSGPISFWKVLSETTNAIQQGAFRRGANMGMMSVSHPDILKFLHAKQDRQAFNNFNISVKITDDWMTRLKQNPHQPHQVTNPRTKQKFYLPRNLDIWQYQIQDIIEVPSNTAENEQLLKDQPGRFWTIGQLWHLIVSHAHRTGEPGVAFIDRINRDNTTPQLGPIEATNPCGEQPLLPYEACNLGSINLARFVTDQPTEQGTLLAQLTELEQLRRIDFESLCNTVHEAVRFLDDVIETNDYHIDKIDQICHANRKIGLGVMGFADLLYLLRIPYDSETALALGRELMKFINNQAHQAGENLAQQRGTFPNYPGSLWQTRHNRPQRNAAVTTVAPTGTLSIIADCSGGIEPMFSVAFQRNILGGTQLLEVNQVFEQLARQQDFYRPQLIEQIAERGSLADFDEIPESIRKVFVCAHDIEPHWHVRMQAAFQENCDAAISKTINFPNHATVEQVDQIYRLAHELDCKGITVYRDGCRSGQPMAKADSPPAESPDSESSENSQGLVGGLPSKPVKPIDLPEIMTCLRVRQITPFGNMHVKITVDPISGRELEVFAQLGKGGDIANSDLEAICRLLSLLLRCGGSFDLAIKQLEGIGSSLTIPSRQGRIMSLADGLAKAMSKYLHAKQKNGLEALLLGKVTLAEITNHGNIKNERSTATERAADQNCNGGVLAAFKIKCPCCAGVLCFTEGCVKCHNCGFSQC